MQPTVAILAAEVSEPHARQVEQGEALEGPQLRADAVQPLQHRGV